MRRESEFSWQLVVAVVTVGAAGLYGCFVVDGPHPGPTAPAGSWIQRSILLVGAATPPPPTCTTISSSFYSDTFCLSLSFAAAGELLNGTFDHGTGGPVDAIHLAEGPPCIRGCPSGASWISPDGTGELVWNFTNSVTLGVLN